MKRRELWVMLEVYDVALDNGADTCNRGCVRVSCAGSRGHGVQVACVHEPLVRWRQVQTGSLNITV